MKSWYYQSYGKAQDGDKLSKKSMG